MCLVIVTVRLLAWGTLTLISATTIYASLTTPQWLVGPPTRIRKNQSHSPSALQPSVVDDFIRHNDRNSEFYQPSLGVYNRCIRTPMYPSLHCASFISRIDESDYFPTSWQATLVFFSAGLCLLMLTLIFSIAGWCVRSICRKSIFSIGGSVQALAVLLFTVGLVIYPAGWNSSRVRNICGEEADTFLLADCSLGWAFYGAAAGILLTCFSAVFSIQAEVSTSTDKIQDRILQGKKIICLP